MLQSTWNASTVKRDRIGRWWIVVIAAALFGAGIFYPYTPHNLASAIHGLCGAIVIVTFPIVATLYGSALARSQDWIGSRGQLRWSTVLVWVGLLSLAGSIVVLGIISQPVDRSNPNLLIGCQNRFMIVIYSLWLMAVAWQIALPNSRRA